MTDDDNNDYYDDREFISEIARDVKEQLKDAKRQIKEAKKEAKREAKEKAREAKEDFTRINFTLPGKMKEEWKNMAKDLSKSVSQLVRDAMSRYKSEIYNVTEEIGKEMGQLGDKFAKIVEGTGTKPPRPPKPPKPPMPFVRTEPSQDFNIERLKKRVEGLIKIKKCLPLKKFAQALNITPEDAENLIYELAAEGINGSIEDDVFKFTNEEDEVIDALFTIFDRS